MANFPEVPTFTRGEPGFADKLNQLGSALRAVIAHIESTPAVAPAAEPASKPTRKAATTAK